MILRIGTNRSSTVEALDPTLQKADLLARDGAAQPPVASMTRAIGSLWARRGLIVELARRDVEQRYRGSLLGPLWSVAYPLFQLAVYTIIFGFALRVPWPGLPDTGFLGRAVLYYCGFVPVLFFNECLSRAPRLIVSSPNYVKKVVFPLEILPVSAGLAALFQLVVNLLVLVLAYLLSGGRLGWTFLLAPVVFVPLFLLVIGASWLLSSIGVIVRDVSHGLGLMLQLVPFVTPVFYPVDAMPPKLQVVLRFNPLTPIVENLRMTLLWQRTPNWAELGLWTAAGTLVLIAGYWWFEYTRADFADVV